MYETVLATTDGSQESLDALDHALELASDVDAVVYVLTVVDTDNPMQFGIAEVDELNQAAEELVEDIVTVHEGQAVEIHGDVRRGKPVSGILDYAEEIDADLIVAGKQGNDRLADAILGSTTERLAQLSDIPLIIVPAVESEQSVDN